MSAGGWIFMISSVGFVVGLCAYCFYTILTKPSTTDQLHAPATIETKDEET